MSITKITRTPSSPIQRLAARILRQRDYSLSQISAITDLSSATVFYATAGIDLDNLEGVTLNEIGAPGNSTLFSELLGAATEYVEARLVRREAVAPRGFRLTPSPTAVAA